MSGHVSDLLSAYIDGVLGVRDVERVRAHLDTCPSCHMEYQGLQDVQRLLAGLPDPTPRPGFMDRVSWRLAREAARQSHLGLVSRVASVFRVLPVRLALAVTAMVVVLVLPWALVTGQFGSREVPLDTDAYVRHYLFLSSDRSLVDEATTTFVSNPNRGTSDQPTR
jgi:anti-sigma factor RsiW